MIRSRARRGFTLVELLVASSTLALFFGLAVATIFPVLNYITAGQAKIDTQANAVPVLYRIQREIRQSDARAIYYRPTSGGSAVALPSTLTSITTFAVATAKQGANGDSCYPGGAFDTAVATGGPNWHGFEVYTLTSDGTLDCVYETWTSPAPTPPTAVLPTAAQADNAITTGLAVTNSPLFGNAVFNIQMAAESPVISGHAVTIADVKIQALATVNGRTNATTYTQNILTRR
jgi:prepilin-type N-terminal cleavage/methylation domain-containing protein